MAQKVISVNLYIHKTSNGANTSPYTFSEIKEVNELLEDGWAIKETIHSIPGGSSWVNITFILDKPEGSSNGQYSVE